VVVFSGLNTWPTHTPTNASPPASRLTTHSSGPAWIATPSPYETCIRYTAPPFRRTPHPLLPRGCYGYGRFPTILPFLTTFPPPRWRPPRHENEHPAGRYPWRRRSGTNAGRALCWCSKPAITLVRVA